jgi:hypothetical protein
VDLVGIKYPLAVNGDVVAVRRTRATRNQHVVTTNKTTTIVALDFNRVVQSARRVIPN